MNGYSFIYLLIGVLIYPILPMIISHVLETQRDLKSTKRINDFLNSDEYKIKSYSKYCLNKVYPIRRDQNYRYSSHCWKCKAPIDSEFNLKCSLCGWYICSVCGSCEYRCTAGKEILKEAVTLIDEVSKLPDDDTKKILFNAAKIAHITMYMKQRHPGLQHNQDSINELVQKELDLDRKRELKLENVKELNLEEEKELRNQKILEINKERLIKEKEQKEVEKAEEQRRLIEKTNEENQKKILQQEEVNNAKVEFKEILAEIKSIDEITEKLRLESLSINNKSIVTRNNNKYDTHNNIIRHVEDLVLFLRYNEIMDTRFKLQSILTEKKMEVEKLKKELHYLKLKNEELVKKLYKLKVGNILVHNKYGEMEVIKITNEYIYTKTLNGDEIKKFKNDSNLTKYISEIV